MGARWSRRGRLGGCWTCGSCVEKPAVLTVITPTRTVEKSTRLSVLSVEHARKGWEKGRPRGIDRRLLVLVTKIAPDQDEGLVSHLKEVNEWAIKFNHKL